jgi:hypothetical protein
MPTGPESEARKALQRLRRAIEKAGRELEALEGALRHAEGDDFPEHSYRTLQNQLSAAEEFIDDESRRLQEKVLHAGGLEPGRVRRSGGL